MERILLVFMLLAVGSLVNGEDVKGRQFSSDSFYITNPTQNHGDHIRFPDDGSTSADLDTAESMARLQGLQFFAIQNGNIPLLIYPISNGGETSSESTDDLHGMATAHQSQAKSSEGSSSAFEESLKNVAHGYIFPSSPETSHTDIFKQLMEAGSHGPAPEPYIIPTPQMNKPIESDPIIAIPIPSINIYKEDDGQQSLLTAYNIHQIPADHMLLSQNMDTVENQQQQSNPQYPTDINAIPLELQYLKDKPSHYHMVGPHQFLDEVNTEPPAEKEMPLPPPPFRDIQNPPLQPPPPMKASTYGPPKPMHGSSPGNHGNRYRPPMNRPPSPPHHPPYPPKGNSPHSKVPTKMGPPHHPFRLHPGPHQHHGGHHHHGHQHHPHSHHHPEPHYHHHHHDDHHRPPPKFPHYEIHEVKGHPGGHSHSNRPPPSTHKHPYNFHYRGPPKQGSLSSAPTRGSGIPGPPRPPFPNPESQSKPNSGFGPQKGSQPYGPPKSSSYNPPPNTNLVTSHPSITKAIFHSPEQPQHQNGEYSPSKDSLSYPNRPEYSIEISPTTHATPYQRPSDVSVSGSLSDSYVTGPPRVNYPDEEEEEEPSPPVEVYNSPSDAYQRGKQPLKAPVIVYKGVRPPVRVYQKPETGPPYHHLPNPHTIRGSQIRPSYSPSIESTWVNSASPPYYHQQRVRGSYSVASPSVSSKSTETSLTKSSKETHHITTASPFRYSPGAPSTGSSSSIDSFSSSSDDSSSWTPINAPAGAVPARGYHMSAPDLSRGLSYPTNHNSYYSSANSRADVEDLVLTDQSGSSHSLLSANTPLTTAGGNQMRLENNSEEVVSAVVLVKHR
ncbi:hypothetical protein J437_LFUL006562 [Ladona fulva]|uniref:Uncharacterized protein n=1 Tax=Ladona fulva TaxID=123851 RepID=A0A8K0K744_LADFU|nr:hypothetical protein J437_LFUL006562 [Ladona fulva]